MTLQELNREIATKSAAVEELFLKADERGDGVNTKEEMDSIKALNKEIEEHEKRASDLREAASMREANSGRIKALDAPIRDIPVSGGQKAERSNRLLSDLVLESPAMKDWLKQVAGDGYGPSPKVSLQSPRIPVGGFSMKTLLTGASATSAGALITSDRKPIIDSYYQRPLTIRDLITIGQTDSDAVEYVRVTGVTNNAAAVPEATASGNGSGAKPESAMALVRVSEAVKTVAHWIPATNRALSDSSQLRTLIDTFLTYGLAEELEDQMMIGDGVGENFTGVEVVSGTTAQAFATDVLTTTRKGRTKVRITGRAQPTGWVMHPNDWEAIDLLQDNEKRYFYGGPSVMGSPRLWGLPVVESEAITEGKAIVADWRMAVLWERMSTQISMTNSHSDFFVRNLVAILAEFRAAFGLLRPAAFVICDLTA